MAETTNPHRIEVTIDNGGRVDGVMKCDAPEGADCRMWCDEGCGQAGPDHGTLHKLSDQGYCYQTEGWFDDDIIGMYSGAVAPLRSGPVKLDWEGDYYTWLYDTEPDGSGMTADTDPALDEHRDALAFIRENSEALGLGSPHSETGDERG